MTHPPYDFGPVARLEPDTIGEPGNRTFRILVTGEEGTASLWLEKEELQALGVAADQLLARVSGNTEWKVYGTPPDPFEPTDGFLGDPLVEFKIGQLSLGYESDSKMFVLMIHDVEADPEGPATFTCLATSAQMRLLSRRISSVVAAGRPRCPLCGDALEPEGHACVRAN